MPRVNSLDLDPEKWQRAHAMATERLNVPPRGVVGSEQNRQRMKLAGRVHQLALQIYDKEL
jgi:hypothetical protein